MQMKVLVVDDEPQSCLGLESVFLLEGYKVTKAYNAEQGFLETEEQEFDLIVTDFQMPGMDGLELIRNVRYKTPDMPCLMVTAFNELSLTRDIAAMARCEILEKPLKLKPLRQAIRKLVRLGDTGEADE